MHQRDLCLCPPCVRKDIVREVELDKDDQALAAGRQPKGPEPVVLLDGVVRRVKRAA